MEEREILTNEVETNEIEEGTSNRSGKGLGIIIGIGLGVAGTAIVNKIKKVMAKRKRDDYDPDEEVVDAEYEECDEASEE